MPVYGYKKGSDSDLLELREVSFELGADALRQIARFLQLYADQLDSGTWRSGHVHMDMFDPNWPAQHPEIDIIICNQGSEPAKRNQT